MSIQNVIKKALKKKGAKFRQFLEKEKISTLKAIEKNLSDLYYNEGSSPFSDAQYDILREIIQEKDADYVPKVGAKLREEDNRVQLPFWLGSADKITPLDSEKLKNWVSKNPSPDYVVSEKLDGVSCLAGYVNGKIFLYTRGDGEEGADISYLAPYFKLPKIKKDIYLRGELIMKRKTFDNVYKKTYRNPRNLVAGVIGAKTAREALKDIDFVTYEIVGDSMYKQSEQLQELEEFGFKTVKYTVIKKVTIPELTKLYNAMKADSEYDIDGIMIHANTDYDRNTSGNPDYMFAFKVQSENTIFQTEVTGIEWKVSKWGQIKPTILLKKVEGNGYSLSRASGHNAANVEAMMLGKGAIVKITRSKDVIPYITEVVKPAKTPEFPNIPYEWDENHVNILAKKVDNEVCVKLISIFFLNMRIKYVSEATVRKMFENGLDNLIKIVSASKSRLLEIPSFHDKSAERIRTNIHKGLQNIKVYDLLGAVGVFGFGIGKTRLKTLFLFWPNIMSEYKKMKKKDILEKITNVEGFSKNSAEKVVENLEYADMLLQKLKPFTTFTEQKRVSDSMQEHKYVMTGFRDKEIEDQIAQRGGKVVTSVSKNTTMVIAKNKNETSGKLTKARDLGIPVVDKETFWRKLKNP